MEQSGFRVEYLLREPYPRTSESHAYIEALLARRAAPDEHVLGVLAFCMAGALGAGVASTVGAPLLICFEPELSTSSALAGEYAKQRRSLGGRGLPPWWDQAQLDSRPDQLVANIEEDLLALALSASGPGSTPGDMSPLVGFYIDWLCHLIASRATDAGAFNGCVYEVASRDLAARSIFGSLPEEAHMTIPCDRDTLLSDERTAKLTVTLLERGTSLA